MQWLTDRFTREGPGIPKDAPKKTGLALFCQIAGREAVELFKLNLLVILFSLPLVTVFAAQAAAMRVASAMVRDENVYLAEDFWRAFREVFLVASLTGLVLSLALALGVHATFVYAQFALHTPGLSAAFVFALAVTTGLAVFGANLFALLAEEGGAGGLAASARTAFLATLARPLPVLGALSFTAMLWLAHILLYPVSVFMPVAINFSLGALAMAFGTGASLGWSNGPASDGPSERPKAQARAMHRST